MTLAELEKVHPDYEMFRAEWLFYIRSYLGGKFYRDGDYLLKHPLESDDNYQRRKATAYYYNYCAPVIDIYGSYLYKKPPVRSYADLSSESTPPRQPVTLFDSFWWDVDFEGMSFDMFIRDAERLASIYGRVSIIVDKPALSVDTQAQAQAFDVRPYLTLITPENLLDWTFIRLPNGRPVLDKVKVLEVNTKEKKQYRIWTREGWELYEVERGKQPILLGVGLHGLGEVPMVNLYNRRSGIRMIGVSDLKDISDINKNIYYLCSDAKEIIENTAFPMLAMPYSKAGTGEKEIGPKNILEFDPEVPNGNPFWLEAPHNSLAEVRQWVMQDADEIARIALMGGLRNVETSTQPWSGVSIESQAQQLFAALVEKADNAEQAELEILRLWCKWEEREFTGSVVYPKDFAVRDLTIALQNAITARSAGVMSTTFEKERQKVVATATLPYLDEVVREKINEEIEAQEIDLAMKQNTSEDMTSAENSQGMG